ncbi:T-cell immunoreceptor with Ig and ITIM domains-like [Mobula hypostoma]|uniref:T-cell immunoreceptor with Ig and ITIM domains-like n=1 Tax=Mobula hypostoma TaxID=723540 RepID=UPI002FC2D4AB
MIRTVIVCLLIVSDCSCPSRASTVKWGSTQNSVRASQLESRSVTAVKGSSAVLECSSSKKELQLVLVEWEKFTNRTKLGVYHVSSRNTTLNNERIKLEVNGRRSTITIKDILMSDKGCYYCVFHTFPAGKLEGEIYLDVKDKEMSFNQAAYIITGVIVAVIATGILILLLNFVHQRKSSRIHLPNQINVILQSSPSTDNVDTASQPDKPPTPNSDSEDSNNDYFNVVIRSSL